VEIILREEQKRRARQTCKINIKFKKFKIVHDPWALKLNVRGDPVV
jgi:hypothetical protein